MRRTTGTFLLSIFADTALSQSCPDYSSYAQQRHEPYSSGKHALSYQRPSPSCRTFNSTLIESTIANISSAITDPDLARLFENSYPNTLDTAIKWHGTAASNPAEELTFIITGDIDAMWLRDSTNQLQSYAPLLTASSSPTSLASLYRGAINLQGRYLLTAPYCNSFQAPPESGIAPAHNSAADSDRVVPGYDRDQVFECKYELDSLASFLEISASYWGATRDLDFFAAFHWVAAVQAVLKTARAMTTPTYGEDGVVLGSPYTFIRDTTRATETLANDGLGNPVGRGTGLVRSAFRPSDDSAIFQFLVPANMMFAGYLGKAAEIVAALEGEGKAPGGLSKEMKGFADDIRAAITQHGVVSVVGADGGAETIYAYEVDGFGSANVMDDANIPSLLSAPLLGYLDRDDPLYQRTRERILGQNGNPYFMRGPAINAVGGPHVGPGMAWPMASIVRILTSDDDKEITDTLKDLVSTTDGLGLIHESINTFNPSRWTRQWFSWANGLFGQMIIDLHSRKPDILKKSFQ
ncbi:hypothetical protein B0T25DRAFT_625252 [Lasiosphaeria hispida]|uniref:Glycoside hydrolase family 125 protein n=1 Tax=Lasiosphaeria hispida TaxID=260671 RepID=A0AAJ0MBF3_9PEZI|nr:hypothetical protein B0T25DRAFT_625252 [Lasiosphaeria hispida]